MIEFSGYEWNIKTGSQPMGPGQNYWSRDNVSIDKNGHLCLRIKKRNSVWTCAIIYTKECFGFGRYRFKVIGQIDQMDKNIVLGMFNYPNPGFGHNLDGSNEIDIEISGWGSGTKPKGYFVVWPREINYQHYRMVCEFPLLLNGTYTTHCFDWKETGIVFQSQHGHRNDDKYIIQNHIYKPKDFERYIPNNPMPIHLNLWLCKGLAPSDNKEFQIRISEFEYLPEE